MAESSSGRLSSPVWVSWWRQFLLRPELETHPLAIQPRLLPGRRYLQREMIHGCPGQMLYTVSRMLTVSPAYYRRAWEAFLAEWMETFRRSQHRVASCLMRRLFWAYFPAPPAHILFQFFLPSPSMTWLLLQLLSSLISLHSSPGPFPHQFLSPAPPLPFHLLLISCSFLPSPSFLSPPWPMMKGLPSLHPDELCKPSSGCAWHPIKSLARLITQTD